MTGLKYLYERAFLDQQPEALVKAGFILCLLAPPIGAIVGVLLGILTK